MTHHTDAERAAYERELIDNHHYVPSDFSFKDGFYGGDDDYIQFGWDLWQAARRAPAVQVPKVTDEMIEAAEEAYMPFGDMHLAIQAALAAAPQPPEVAQSNSAEFDGVKTKVAPVQLPEPVAKVEDGGLKWHIPDSGYSLPVRYLQGTHKLYTEQQVRELLANHGIQEKQG